MVILYFSCPIHTCSPDFYKQECPSLLFTDSFNSMLVWTHVFILFHGLVSNVPVICCPNYTSLTYQKGFFLFIYFLPFLFVCFLIGSVASWHVPFFFKYFLVSWLHKCLRLLTHALPFESRHRPLHPGLELFQNNPWFQSILSLEMLTTDGLGVSYWDLATILTT